MNTTTTKTATITRTTTGNSKGSRFVRKLTRSKKGKTDGDQLVKTKKNSVKKTRSKDTVGRRPRSLSAVERADILETRLSAAGVGL